MAVRRTRTATARVEVASDRGVFMTAELGLNLAGVERVLALEEQLERAQRKVDALERRRAQLEADIARLEAVRREVRAELIPYRQFADALKPPSRAAAAD